MKVDGKEDKVWDIIKEIYIFFRGEMFKHQFPLNIY